MPVPRTAEAISEAYRAGETSPGAVLEELLGMIEGSGHSLNCFITVLNESARRDAAASDKRYRDGRRIGPLDGIPVAVKDLIFIEGVRCTAGSKILEDNVAAYDAPVIRRLKASGAIIVGTTNMHEFAAGVTSNNPHYGPVRNPWDRQKVAGGSSGGSAAAVAAGLVPCALGTDTGGSVRIPAGLCGVLGLKPTYGLVSRLGVIPLAASFDTVGVLANSARDCADTLQVIAGHDQGDLTSADQSVPDFGEALAKHQAGSRLGVVRDYFLEAVDPSVASLFETFVERLDGLGHTVAEVTLGEIKRMNEVWSVVRGAESAAFHSRWLESVPEKYGEDVRKSLQSGARTLATEYINAQNIRPWLRDAFLGSMSGVDVLVVPTTSVPAPAIGEEMVRVGNRDMDVRTALIGLTMPFNVVGFPVLSVPIGLARGLPVGAQLVARPFEESTLLSLAGAYEASFGLFKAPQ